MYEDDAPNFDMPASELTWTERKEHLISQFTSNFGDAPRDEQLWSLCQEVEAAALADSCDGTKDEYFERVSAGLVLLDMIASAVHAPRSWPCEADPDPSPMLAKGILWHHHDAADAFRRGRSSPAWAHIDRSSLHLAAEQYLSQKWIQSDRIEWILANAFVYCELSAFGDSIKQGDFEPDFMKQVEIMARNRRSGGDLSKQRKPVRMAANFIGTVLFKLAAVGFFALLVAAVLATTSDGIFSQILGAALVIALWRSLFPINPPKRPADRAVEALTSMLPAGADYLWGAHEGSGIVSVRRIQRALEKTDAVGAVWDNALHAIVDRAAMRPDPFWRMTAP